MRTHEEIGFAGQSARCQQLPSWLLRVLTPESSLCPLAMVLTNTPVGAPRASPGTSPLPPAPPTPSPVTLTHQNHISFAQPDLTRKLTHVIGGNLCSGAGSPVLVLGSLFFLSSVLFVFVVVCFNLQTTTDKILEPRLYMVMWRYF